jgi:hypothetical protein
MPASRSGLNSPFSSDSGACGASGGFAGPVGGDSYAGANTNLAGDGVLAPEPGSLLLCGLVLAGLRINTGVRQGVEHWRTCPALPGGVAAVWFEKWIWFLAVLTRLNFRTS